ncbi:hypothetical protein XBO1_1960007 [Xenorhabdus bovienii str. oregonense]|uniref:Uncharacterized protein n=1 Tax=Xenorhabdus bovienii str. oregonense TaxID=1398202 RepID=A0A077NTR1_XENBV|nr:hypothetical protein XBO1_1960007 [Xenorhabdus bovienii str. oregonense]
MNLLKIIFIYNYYVKNSYSSIFFIDILLMQVLLINKVNIVF